MENEAAVLLTDRKRYKVEMSEHECHPKRTKTATQDDIEKSAYGDGFPVGAF
jgi:hypothetical protein